MYLPCSKPFFSRRNLSGKGHAIISVSTARDITATELIIYHTWDFFSFQDRVTLSRLSPTYIAHASLYYDATHETPSTLRSKLNHIPVAFHDTLISPIRARNMCKVLLLFHFDFGNLVRWLGGDYTYDHIDHDSIKETFVTLRFSRIKLYLYYHLKLSAAWLYYIYHIPNIMTEISII